MNKPSNSYTKYPMAVTMILRKKDSIKPVKDLLEVLAIVNLSFRK